MKKTLLVSRFAIVAVASSGLCFAGNLYAQGAISDNPHLRAKEAPPKASAQAAQMSERDKNFVLKASAGGQQEVENGMMAEKRAKEAATKAVAKRMVEDHTRANKELTALAKNKGLGVTTDNIKAQSLPEANFDRQYLHDLKHYHQEDIALFQKQAREGNDAELKAWAAKTLPTLKEHLSMVDDTIKNMK